MKLDDSVLYILYGCKDSSMEEIYSNLFKLYRDRTLENNFAIIDIDSRSQNKEKLKQRISRSIERHRPTEIEQLRFLEKVHWFNHTLDSTRQFIRLNLLIQILEEELSLSGNRIIVLDKEIDIHSLLLDTLKRFELFSSEKLNRIIVHNDDTTELVPYLINFPYTASPDHIEIVTL